MCPDATEGDAVADLGRLLHPDDRAALLARFPPAYARVDALHFALEGGERPDFPLPSETEGFVVGMADDGEGMQALVVEIGGTTRRPDGTTYHIPWSFAPSRKAAKISDVIRLRGWTAVKERHRVRLGPNPMP